MKDNEIKELIDLLKKGQEDAEKGMRDSLASIIVKLVFAVGKLTLYIGILMGVYDIYNDIPCDKNPSNFAYKVTCKVLN